MRQTEKMLAQGKALFRAIEALETIDAVQRDERQTASRLVETYRRGLREIVASALAWVSEEIVSANQRIDDGRWLLWMSDN